MLFSKKTRCVFAKQLAKLFQKAKGCKIQSLSKKEYLDFSIMGIGTNILGYANKEVDNAVTNAVKNGNMSTLNCAEEVHLAERLVELHPWASS